ncbi:MAG: TlpA disulfide reductase family protein [Flavobacteriaceae bacterium]
MKLYFYSLLAAFFIVSSCSEKASISGVLEVPEDNSYTLYLIQPQGFNEIASPYFGTVIDSAIVQKDGSFAFRNLPTLTAPTLFVIALQPQGNRPNQLINDNPTTDNYMPLVWQTGEILSITANSARFQQSFSIQNPSTANSAMLQLRNAKVVAFQQFLQNKEWDIHEGTQLLEKEDALLEYQKAMIDFAQTTDAFLPALVAVRWVSPQQDYERTAEFLFAQCERWKEKEPAHPWTQQLCEKADKSALPVLVGDSFPNTELPMLSGEMAPLYPQLGSKLTIIDLWASWCVPCRKENREILVPLWEAYHDKGFQILGYGLESNEAAWKAAIEKDGAYRWPHASHLQGDDAPFMQVLRIQTIPANFILDAQGKVIAKNLHGNHLARFVETYLKS